MGWASDPDDSDDSNNSKPGEDHDEIWNGEETGLLRLFPLPGFVMFPHVAHPFHLFEPRYLAMAEEALNDDQLIAMAVLQPGWEAEYEGRPPIFPTVCVGRISAHAKTEQGTLNIILRGITRAKIIEELPGDGGIRRVYARRVMVPDVAPEPSQTALQHRLRIEMESFLLERGAEREDIDLLLRECGDLPKLTDIVTFSMIESFEERLQLLEEYDPVARARGILRHFTAPPNRPNFPPPFSDN